MNAALRAQVKAKSASSAASFSAPTGLLQRKCACGGAPGVDGECAACRQKRLQRKSAGQAETTGVPPIVHEVLRSPGQPLDPATRAFMEPRFGHDFSAVRIHTDARAAESARVVNAAAYTVGRTIVFGEGRYEPSTAAGRKLLAHEVTHTIQQESGPGQADHEAAPAFFRQPGRVAPIYSSLEQEADRNAEAIAGMTRLSVSARAGAADVQRAGLEEGPAPLRGATSYVADTELITCMQIMGEGSREACLQQIGENPQPTGCVKGHQRTVSVQPVFFRSDDADAAPTGTSWASRFTTSNTIWNKLGVTFTDLGATTLTDSVNKSAGGSRAERDRIRALQSGAGIEVFMVDNDLADAGGGGTVGGGSDAAKMVLSDRGTSDTILAHELGHVLGLGHPPADAAVRTIMEPSGSHSADNPTRNTMDNYHRITWPAPGPLICINPDI